MIHESGMRSRNLSRVSPAEMPWDNGPRFVRRVDNLIAEAPVPWKSVLEPLVRHGTGMTLGPPAPRWIKPKIRMINVAIAALAVVFAATLPASRLEFCRLEVLL